jgi:hypothetical protein
MAKQLANRVTPAVIEDPDQVASRIGTATKAKGDPRNPGPLGAPTTPGISVTVDQARAGDPPIMVPESGEGYVIRGKVGTTLGTGFVWSVKVQLGGVDDATTDALTRANLQFLPTTLVSNELVEYLREEGIDIPLAGFAARTANLVDGSSPRRLH